jgi:hypothetical protein
VIAEASFAIDAGAPISPDLLARLRPLIAATGSALSEYSLANLLLFRDRHHYRFIDAPIPAIFGITYDGVHHAMPLAPVDGDACAALLDHAECVGPIGAGAPALAARLGLLCEWRDSDSDYVYDAARLAILAGAKAKRAQAQAFERECRPEALPLDSATCPLAEQVLDGWFADIARPAPETDLNECREALGARERLDLDGMIVTVARRPVAFLLAGPGADGSRIVHFAKGRRAFSGAYPWLFAYYAGAAGAGRLNFEQDLGKPGFAQAKRAFAPIERLRKYRLRRR